MKALLAIVTATTGCGGGCGLDLERMIDQPRYSAFEACDVCPDGTIMMEPPAGTVHRRAELASSELATGLGADGRHVADIPVPGDAALIARGRNRFDIYCAACHGPLANGISQVAENMKLRAPPNLMAAPYASRPPGYVFAVVTRGFGLMRSYAAELPVRDRWAVIAYLQVLQLAQHVALRELSEEQQQEARQWLK
jgi:mono/diheme cytochrome c family protein